ncbi:hypothetical protein RvY_10150 [Ramazzottius varieornatus]|uniref:Pre-mRNA-splicing factor SLU7 n=1 Tax=Ramazzottius varieornatus TaxID=947166 RepID=A0A1D1VBU0_RAMVA|nr:hypothetical protein RvY_10150 [Ramazzottius varieornatus]
MATPTLPVSEIIRTKNDASAPKKTSRDDYRLAKELEEARKAGTVPAEQDEHGRDINPHIPHYIAVAPWYLGSKGPTLTHQRAPQEKQKEYAKISDNYKRGVNANSVTTKFRKGACENCGAMTHKKKDCMERPRKLGAKYTGEAIAPDEFVQSNINHDFEGKRDRWNGYDASQYKEVVSEYEKIEDAKKLLKAEKILTEDTEEFGKDLEDVPAEKVLEAVKAADDDMNNEDKYADDMEMPGTKVDSKQRITVRNLRIREDTAKYLINLDLTSAYYDPKTRSMREDPLADKKVKNETQFSGENAIRYSGETNNIAKSQLFAWDAYEKGVDVHLQADPTKAELLKKQYEEKKTEFKQNIGKNILQKYGGEEYLEAPPKEMLLAQTETFIQYSRGGDVLKGLEKPVVRSRYEEDVYNQNHTTVWGSFWENGSWGYKCCHSFVKMSYCTGVAGILARRGKEVEKDEVGPGSPTEAPPARTEAPTPIENKFGKPADVSSTRAKRVSKGDSNSGLSRQKRKRSKSSSSSSSSSSDSAGSSSSSSSSEDEEGEEEKRKKKVAAALKAQEEQQKEAERLMNVDERRRPYNSLAAPKKITEEEMEAYQLRKVHADDPMAGFMNR